MKKVTFLLSLSLLFLYGCSKESLTTENSGENYTQETLLRGPGGGNGNGIINHASLAGNDFCGAVGLPPGCDANFSLVANKKADGTVTGQWQDTFAGGSGYIHVAVDCLEVVGNAAIVSGFITHGNFNGVDLAGLYAVTAVWDNGTSNNDPDDQLSFSFFGVNFIIDGVCDYDINIFPRFELTRGQVKVW